MEIVYVSFINTEQHSVHFLFSYWRVSPRYDLINEGKEDKYRHSVYFLSIL